MPKITKSILVDLYGHQRKSVREIAKKFTCSENKINYWLQKHGIKKRSISDAIYQMHNPSGDPFRFRQPRSFDNVFLYGLGIGLYWGEGTKKNKHSVRLANSDPKLIKAFLKFLTGIYGIRMDRLRFGLHMHSDMSEREVRAWWAKELGVSESRFQRAHIKPKRTSGTYLQKAEFGVLTVYFYSSKLQRHICDAIKKL